jgi:hypothetical protein
MAFCWSLWESKYLTILIILKKLKINFKILKTIEKIFLKFRKATCSEKIYLNSHVPFSWKFLQIVAEKWLYPTQKPKNLSCSILLKAKQKAFQKGERRKIKRSNIYCLHTASHQMRVPISVLLKIFTRKQCCLQFSSLSLSIYFLASES